MTDYQLWLGDCLEEMSRIEAGSVDMICADLPYGTTACKWDVVLPFEPLWKHYKRVIKRNGAIVLFGTFPFTALLWASNPDWYKYDWTWYKNSVTGMAFASFQPMRCKEEILIFSNGAIRFNKQPTRSKISDRKLGGKNGVRTTPSNHYAFAQTGQQIMLKEWVNPRNVLEFDIEPMSQGRLHPTQKPVALLEYLIKTYSNEGDLILDNTCGSGSTLEAAMRNKRRSIGIEKDAHYYQVASQRLERVAAELRGEYVPKPAKRPIEDLPMFERVTV